MSAAYLSKAKQDTTQLDLDGWGADLFFNTGPFSAQAEYGQYDQDTATDDIVGKGWYAQAGYLVRPRIELTARYQELDPTSAASDDRLQWTSVGANFYIRGHNLKVQTDYTFKREQGTQTSNDLFQVQPAARLLTCSHTRDTGGAMQPFGLALGAAVLTTVACRAYAFTATSSGGARFAGRATPSHHLPPPSPCPTACCSRATNTHSRSAPLAGGNASFVETTFATPDKESP